MVSSMWPEDLDSVCETQSKKLRVLISWISNNKIKLKKINKKFPVLLQSCRPRTGRPVGISNTA